MLQYTERAYPQYAVCPFVYLSVTLSHCDHTGWNTSKITSWSNGKTPKLRWNTGGVQKPARPGYYDRLIGNQSSHLHVFDMQKNNDLG